MKKNFVSGFNKMKILKGNFNLNKKEYIINVLCNKKLMENINEEDILYENNNKIPLKAFRLYKANNNEKKTHKINFTEILNHNDLFDKLSKEDKNEFNRIKKLKIRNLFKLRNNSNLSFINKYKKYLDTNNKTKNINNTEKLNSNNDSNKIKILSNTNNNNNNILNSYIQNIRNNSNSNKSIKISTSSTTIKSMSISPYNSKKKSINLQKTCVNNNYLTPSFNNNILITSNNSKDKNIKILYKNKNYNNNFNRKYYSTQISNNVSLSNINNDNALKITEYEKKFDKVIKKKDIKNILKKIKLLELKDDVKYYEKSLNSDPNLEKNSLKNICNYIRPAYKSCDVVNFNKTNYDIKNNLKIYLNNPVTNHPKSYKKRFKSFDKIFYESNRKKEQIKDKIYFDIKKYKDNNFHQIYYRNYLEKNKDRKDWIKDNIKFLRDEVIKYSQNNGPFIYNENGSGNYVESHKKIKKGDLIYKQSVLKTKQNYYIDVQKNFEIMQKNKKNDIINENYLKNKKNL